MTVEVLDFQSFLRGEKVVIRKERGKRRLYDNIIQIGALTLIVTSTLPITEGQAVYVASLMEVATESGSSWESMINKLLEILDPIAKIFGMIAGVAIMTGNGRIGLERLFWLSIGYITTRKVDDWIQFLATI